MESKSPKKPVNWKHIGQLSRSVLNGVMGDALAARKNPLAIQMGWFREGQPVDFGSTSVRWTNKVVILLHGLTNLETIWDFPLTSSGSESSVKENYGTLLQADFGYTPIHLRYNTGLTLEANGREFSRQLSELLEAYPVPVEELLLVGFSMGGLLMRHAQMAAQETNEPWLPVLNGCFYLGSPHEGSYFERFGVLSSQVLKAIPKDYVQVWADWIDTRSIGIKDLEHGVGAAREGGALGFYAGTRHHFISGSLKGEQGPFVDSILGDAMVEKRSAQPAAAPEGSQFAHFDGISHLPLAYTPRVYEQIKAWVVALNATSPVKEYTGFTPPEGQMKNKKDNTSLSAVEAVSGSLDVAAFVYGRVVDTVARMHTSISREPHQVLQKIPVVADVSAGVEGVHNAIASAVFDSVRKGEQVLLETAGLVASAELKSK